MTGPPLAFYAPLKSPDHPAPSGDRTMARLLLRALDRAGFMPTLASRLRSYEPLGDPARQAAIRDEAECEADALVDSWRAGPAAARPLLWCTYHVYYKAPDWIGPRIARRLAIPYVAIEATRADKRADGPWAEAHRGVESALAAAAILFTITPGERVALLRRQPAGQRLIALPPFLDAGAERPPAPRPAGPVRLLTVAMMRAGDKRCSYGLLADSLARLPASPWHLDIVGDGPAQREIAGLFAPFGARVTFHGRIDDPDTLARLYAGADVFVWPAVNEAYGMVLLEAQAAGCPVVAGGFGGVASAMRPGETGLMPAPGDPAAFAADLARLIDDPALRRRLGAAARRFVREERSLDGAAAILRDALTPLLRPDAGAPA